MDNQYHILNGDCLKNVFPTSIEGERIIARLCLVDGEVKAETTNELLKVRAKFISENYPDFTEKDYWEKTGTEIVKILNISNNTEINLWFEDDLFCQVNLWFILHLLFEGKKTQSIFLVRPKSNSRYSFGKMNNDELVKAYNERTKIEPLELVELSKIWRLYQDNNCTEMFDVAEKVNTKFPFLTPVIQAHKDRVIGNGSVGRPIQSLINTMEDLKTESFGEVFEEFCKREGIYGFGDLQVKRMYDIILKGR